MDTKPRRSTVRSTYHDRSESVPLTAGRSVGAVAMILGLVAVVGTAMLALGLWWFEWRVNAEGQIRRDSFNFQETAREQVVDLNADLATIDVQLAHPDLTDPQAAALRAQRVAIADQLCDIAADITGDTSVIVADAIAGEC